MEICMIFKKIKLIEKTLLILVLESVFLLYSLISSFMYNLAGKQK